jgi:DNA topoisomerase-1
MSWDVPTAEDCPECGQTLFKKSGRGRMKPFCVNEKCPNFLPEEKRGYYKKKTATEGTEGEPAGEPAQAAEKNTAKKATTKKTASKKTASSKKTTSAKKTTTRKTKKTEEAGE